MWRTAVNMIRAHPVIGVGVNTFVLNYSHYKPADDYLHAVYAHNNVLQMAAELGLLGVAAFGFLLVQTYGVWQQLLRHDDPWVRVISTGLGCGIIGFLAAGLLESNLYSSHTNLGFWLWLSTLCALGNAPPLHSH